MNPAPTMTASNQEPTLSDIADKLNHLQSDLDGLKQDTDRFNNRFSDYQKSTQWVVQLAFTLIISATVTVIITAVFK